MLYVCLVNLPLHSSITHSAEIAPAIKISAYKKQRMAELQTVVSK